MKDLLGQEFEQGDLIAHISSGGYGWKTCGIVHGGLTKGGSVRYFGISGKDNAKTSSIIKINKEVFDIIYKDEIERLENIVQQYADNDTFNPHLEKRLEQHYDNVETIEQMIKSYNKEQ